MTISDIGVISPKVYKTNMPYIDRVWLKYHLLKIIPVIIPFIFSPLFHATHINPGYCKNLGITRLMSTRLTELEPSIYFETKSHWIQEGIEPGDLSILSRPSAIWATLHRFLCHLFCRNCFEFFAAFNKQTWWWTLYWGIAKFFSNV